MLNRSRCRRMQMLLGLAAGFMIALSSGAQEQASEAPADPYPLVNEKPDYADIDSYGRAPDSAPNSSPMGSTAASGGDLLGGPSADEAGGPDIESIQPSFASRAGEVAMDVIVLRPLGAVATAVGAGFWVSATPFMVFSPDEEFAAAGEAFVGERYRETFERPIGQF